MVMYTPMVRAFFSNYSGSGLTKHFIANYSVVTIGVIEIQEAKALFEMQVYMVDNILLC